MNIDFEKVRKIRDHVVEQGISANNRATMIEGAFLDLCWAILAAEPKIEESKRIICPNCRDPKCGGCESVGEGYVRLTAEDIRTEGDEFKLSDPKTNDTWAPVTGFGETYGNSPATNFDSCVYRRKKPAAEMPPPSECFSTTTPALEVAAWKQRAESEARQRESRDKALDAIWTALERIDPLGAGWETDTEVAYRVESMLRSHVNAYSETAQRAEKAEKERDDLREKLRQAEASLELVRKSDTVNRDSWADACRRAETAEAKVAEQAQTIESIDKDRRDWMRECDDHRVRADKCEVEIERLKGENASLRADVGQEQREKGDLSAEARRLEGELLQANETIAQLKTESSECSRINSEILEQILRGGMWKHETVEGFIARLKSGAFPETFEKARARFRPLHDEVSPYIQQNKPVPERLWNSWTYEARTFAEEALKLEAPKAQPPQCADCDAAIAGYPQHIYCGECWNKQRTDNYKTFALNGLTLAQETADELRDELTAANNDLTKKNVLLEQIMKALSLPDDADESAIVPAIQHLSNGLGEMIDRSHSCTHAQEIEKLRAHAERLAAVAAEVGNKIDNHEQIVRAVKARDGSYRKLKEAAARIEAQRKELSRLNDQVKVERADRIIAQQKCSTGEAQKLRDALDWIWPAVIVAADYKNKGWETPQEVVDVTLTALRKLQGGAS